MPNPTRHSRVGGNPQKLITNNLNIWTAAIKKRGSQGRGSSKKIELYGIKKLRELILELAVRGLLVPQSPNDEPASVLLEKIAAEKAQLIKDGKIKKQKPLPEIKDEEKPFELPKGWEWARLGDITNYGMSDKAEPSSTSADTWVLELEDVEKETSKLLQKVRFIDREFKSSKNIFFEGDVIYGKLRPYLDKVLIADENGVCTTEMIPVRSHLVVTASFLRIAMKAPYFKSYANNSTHGMNLPRMGTDKARLALIPILSEAEQPRIVAKVDELMALCDQLEQQSETSLSAHQTLVETLLKSLLDAAQLKPGHNSTGNELGKNNDPFQSAWNLIADHFNELFTTEHSIDQLKQTILQLAVMGKLVPQNENDEPASVLLEKIAAEKEQLIKDKKIKKQKPLPEISDDEKPFELPKEWEWVRFEDVVDIQSGITKGRKLKGRETAVIPYLSVVNVQRSFLVLDPIKEVEIPLEEVEKYRVMNGDLLITEGGDWDKVGRTAIWRDELAYVGHQNHVFKARIFLKEQSELWLEKYLNSPFSREYFSGSSKQTTNLASINKTQLRGCLIAVPPSEEKNRIVSKLDELMALCDTLKERIRESQTTQLHLADAMAEQALN